jgi:hypothetical protein
MLWHRAAVVGPVLCAVALALLFCAPSVHAQPNPYITDNTLRRNETGYPDVGNLLLDTTEPVGLQVCVLFEGLLVVSGDMMLSGVFCSVVCAAVQRLLLAHSDVHSERQQLELAKCGVHVTRHRFHRVSVHHSAASVVVRPNHVQYRVWFDR